MAKEKSGHPGPAVKESDPRCPPPEFPVNPKGRGINYAGAQKAVGHLLPNPKGYWHKFPFVQSNSFQSCLVQKRSDEVSAPVEGWEMDIQNSFIFGYKNGFWKERK